MSTDRFDVFVIGGGAAGLSAALVLGRARRAVAVVDAGRPRNAPAAHMQGYLSRRHPEMAVDAWYAGGLARATDADGARDRTRVGPGSGRFPPVPLLW